MHWTLIDLVSMLDLDCRDSRSIRTMIRFFHECCLCHMWLSQCKLSRNRNLNQRHPFGRLSLCIVVDRLSAGGRNIAYQYLLLKPRKSMRDDMRGAVDGVLSAYGMGETKHEKG